MFKISSMAAVAVAALMAAGSVYAEALQPLAGNEPADPVVTGTSTLTRQAVEAEAVRHEPAAGQENEAALVHDGAPQTRAEVVRGVQNAEAAGNGFPDQSGNVPSESGQTR